MEPLSWFLFILSNIMGYLSLFLIFKNLLITVFLLAAGSYFLGLWALCREPDFRFSRHRVLLAGPAIGMIFSYASFYRTMEVIYDQKQPGYLLPLYFVFFALLTFEMVKFLWVRKAPATPSGRSLFRKTTVVADKPAETNDPLDLLMLSQLPALYLKENDPLYQTRYTERLASLGISKYEAERLFQFDCDVIRRFDKEHLTSPDFTKTWFMTLQQPFFQTYPKTKEDILKEKSLTLSELCKLIDEAEWHFWNSHENNLPDEVWDEIFQWRISGNGATFASEYFDIVTRETGVPRKSIAAISRENGAHLSRYRWC